MAMTSIAVPAGILGMNIPLNGLETDHTALTAVLGSMVITGICVYSIPLVYLYMGFSNSHERSLKEVRALHNVIQDMDSVEKVFYKLGKTGTHTLIYIVFLPDLLIYKFIYCE